MMPGQTANSTTTTTAQPLATRRYDLDRLRVFAILVLLFYHTGMMYVSWGWHIQSQETSVVFETVMRWLHRWRMPLLFFISGAGTFFALRKRSYGAYASERFKRLFVPLVFGMFVIVPPQIYLEWLFRGRFSGSYAEFYPNVFGFQPYHDGGTGGAFSWHHLWFICYLFLYSLISIPVFMFLKSAGGQRFVDRIERLTARKGGALWLGLVIFISQLMTRPFYPDETHALLNDWAYFVENLLLFWLGYILVSRPVFWQQLADQRRIFLVATLLFTVVMYAMPIIFGFDRIDTELPLDVTYFFNNLLLMWASVLMSVGYSYRYINRNHRLLPYLNEAVYPFYILHQTVIVIIGYWVLKQNFGVYGGFLFTSLATLLVCAGLYWFIIRPFRLTRFLFGLKS
nr:acyltransferase family protein [uncultured Arsenicibacter sp.]